MVASGTSSVRKQRQLESHLTHLHCNFGCDPTSYIEPLYSAYFLGLSSRFSTLCFCLIPRTHSVKFSVAWSSHSRLVFLEFLYSETITFNNVWCSGLSFRGNCHRAIVRTEFLIPCGKSSKSDFLAFMEHTGSVLPNFAQRHTGKSEIFLSFW